MFCDSLKGKTVVIKYGGSIANDIEATDAFSEEIAVLQRAGAKVVVVHGGGPDINRMLRRLNIKDEFIKGLRVTGSSTMEVVEMVLSGRVNKNLASKLVSKGIKAIGISGRDGRLIEAEKLYVDDKGEKIDIGLVGEVKTVNSTLLGDLTDMGYVPVISPVGGDVEGNAYNINGDYAAAAIGISLAADSLVYMSDVDGLYWDINDRGSLIDTITSSEIEELINNGTIYGGMIPKMKCCIDAVEKGVKSVCIVGGHKAHALSELFMGKAAGTIIKGGENHV